jgi:hypothetical protein
VLADWSGGKERNSYVLGWCKRPRSRALTLPSSYGAGRGDAAAVCMAWRRVHAAVMIIFADVAARRRVWGSGRAVGGVVVAFQFFIFWSETLGEDCPRFSLFFELLKKTTTLPTPGS